MMKFTSTALALAAAVGTATAHTTVYAIWVNDVDQGLGNSQSGYIRSPPNNDPVKDVTSTDMTCNVNNVATDKTISVAGGDVITLEWHHNSRDSSDDIIASSHKGPVQTYIAPTSSDGSGDVWVKLAMDGYHSSTSDWAVDTLIANKGKHNVTIPSDLAAGEYLLRPEIIALHEAENSGGAQFYMECVQIKVTSSGATDLPAGIAIPGNYSATDPGILFNMYGTFTSYTPPGGDVVDIGSGSSSTGSSSAASSQAAVATSVAASSVAASSVAATSAAATDAAATSVAATSAAPSTLATVYSSAAVASTSSSSAAASSTGKTCAAKKRRSNRQ